jgi:hypothetical protein
VFHGLFNRFARSQYHLGINGNTKVLGIGTITLTSPKGGELVLRDVLHAPGLPYSLLSLGQFMMAGNSISFDSPYCIIENNTGFHIKSKFEPSYGAASTLFRFRVDFPVAESNLADSKPADFSPVDSKPADSNLADSEPAITDDQIALWHARVGHVATSGLPYRQSHYRTR